MPWRSGSIARAVVGAKETATSRFRTSLVTAQIALYPDSLLSQVLMASTYPLEIVQADRWVKKNPDVKGDPLATALNEQGWDPSVKSLVNFPPVLAMMSENIDKTVKIGDAFLGQDGRRALNGVAGAVREDDAQRLLPGLAERLQDDAHDPLAAAQHEAVLERYYAACLAGVPELAPAPALEDAAPLTLEARVRRLARRLRRGRT